jgi:stearoyl-CoA desaturase (Delta-9 desaturase)
MQIDNLSQGKSLHSLQKKQRITIENDYLKKINQRFAVITTLVPSLGSVLAIGLLMKSGIDGAIVGLSIGMYLSTMLGITVGFHRYFTHYTFKTNRTIRTLLAILGSMAAQGSIVYWVSTHRRHHQYTDLPGDTHSPYIYEGQKFGLIRGLWYAHIGWMLDGEVTNSALFAKDLLQDRVIAKVNQLYPVWVILGLVIPTVLGGVLTATWIGALQGFLWGGLVRIFLGHHAIWGLSSIAHVYGSRPFDTCQQSRNSLWLVIPTCGEGWHHNHHTFPNSAKLGLQWWQVDLGYWLIHVLELFGLAWDIQLLTPEMIEAKKSKLA